MTTTSNNSSVFIFEDETGYATSDGRLLQKDNRYFKGKELAPVSEEQLHETVAYYKEAFEKLRDYIEKQLKLIESEPGPNKEVLDRLVKEVEQADALGDFDTLLERIETAGSQPEEVESAPASDKKPSEEKQADSASEPSDSEESGSSVDTDGEESEKTNSSDTAEVSEDGEATEEATGSESTEEETQDQLETESSPSERGEAGQASENIEEDAGEVLQQYRKFTESAENLAEQTDWQVVQHEFDNLKLKWDELEDVDDQQKTEYEELRNRFNQAEQKFKERREQHFQQLQEKRQKNLQQREQLLEKMRQLVKDEKWNSFNEVKQIQRRWENIKNLPAEEAQKQQEEFDKLFGVFEENKVDYLVEKRQKEEDNLTGKLVILDKLQEVINQAGPKTTSWEQLDEEIESLTRHWRKIGKVPKEQADQIWDRYRALQDQYQNLKYEHNEEYRKMLDRNLKEREALCEQAEKLKDEEDLALAARKINQLHKQWKKVGPVPHEKNEELWQRFKAASDEFNQFKQDHLDDLKEQEQENLDKKSELCEKAEEISQTDDWDEGAKQMNELMEQWKQIGPAPRRKAGKVWKRFKKAMDDFYERRREHFREIRKEQKENYRKKREIIEKIRELAEREDIQEAIKEVKELQEQFKSIGFVPIKKKDKVWKDYKEACDLAYGNAREQSGSASAKEEATSGGGEKKSSGTDKAQKEINRLRGECEKLNDEIVQYSNSKEFIKPNKKGIQLREEIEEKIKAAEAKLKEKQDRIEELRREMDSVEQ